MPSTGNVRIIKDTHGAGLEALAKRLRAGEHRVLVGVPRGAGAEENGVSLAQVAAFTEFGTSTSPERPFLRGGIRKTLPTVRRVAARDLSAVARGTKTLNGALEMTGIVAVGGVKEYMTGPNFAPNAPSTIKKKGSSQPTIDDANLRQSITHVVEGTP
jgi:hypothetical protein